jgi:hypothetical protein
MSSSKKPKAPRRRRPTRRQDMRGMFDRLVLENPRLADAALTALKIIASANRRRAMQLIEAVSTIVMASPRKAPDANGGSPRKP